MSDSQPIKPSPDEQIEQIKRDFQESGIDKMKGVTVSYFEDMVEIIIVANGQ